jgi:hypothetical protein
MKIDLVFLLVIGILVIYQLCSKNNIEKMSNVSNDIKEAVRQVYLADVDAIRNLSDVAKKLQDGGLVNPGNMNVNGKLNIGTAALAKDLPDWLNLSVENGGDSHIRLKTKNDDNKNMYLINRDGHFRIHQQGVGDMLSLNHDGHFSNTHTGDHVAQFVGKGAHPFITLSKEGGVGWYMQNVGGGGLRFGVHGEAHKAEIFRDGNIIFGGRNLMAELNALRAEVNATNNKMNNMTATQIFNISRGGGGWNGRTSGNFTVGTGKKILQVDYSLYVNGNNGVDVNLFFSNGLVVYLGSYINHGGNHTGQSFTRVLENSQLPAGNYTMRATCNLHVDGNDYMQASIITLPI